MKTPISFGMVVFIRRDDNYQSSFYQKAIATGNCFIEVIKEGGDKENIPIDRINLKELKNE